jgi:DNA polymerase/3'-5' exonuclease PolX
VQEIVRTGTLGKLETLPSMASPELVGLSNYPRLDPKRVLRACKKLGIVSADELRAKLERGRNRFHERGGTGRGSHGNLALRAGLTLL